MIFLRAVHGGKHLAVSFLYLLRSRYRIGSHAVQRAAVATKTHRRCHFLSARPMAAAKKITANGTGATGLAFIKSW